MVLNTLAWVLSPELLRPGARVLTSPQLVQIRILEVDDALPLYSRFPFLSSVPHPSLSVSQYQY